MNYSTDNKGNSRLIIILRGNPNFDYKLLHLTCRDDTLTYKGLGQTMRLRFLPKDATIEITTMLK